MRIRLSLLWSLAFLVGILAFAGSANAQFTGNIEGVITDPSGGTVAGGKVTLVNTATSVSATTTADTSGYYRFLSLAPGDYKIRVEASGFSAAESNVHLEYNQTLNVPMEVKVGAATEAITVTDQAPLLNTSETRNQQTLQTQELNTLPLAGRSMISLVTLAPGVSGLGTQTSNALPWAVSPPPASPRPSPVVDLGAATLVREGSEEDEATVLTRLQPAPSGTEPGGSVSTAEASPS